MEGIRSEEAIKAEIERLTGALEERKQQHQRELQQQQQQAATTAATTRPVYSSVRGGTTFYNHQPRGGGSAWAPLGRGGRGGSAYRGGWRGGGAVAAGAGRTYRNQSLVLNNGTNTTGESSSNGGASTSTSAAKNTTTTTTPAKTEQSSSNPNEVVIGGVTFVRDASGRKLVRKAAAEGEVERAETSTDAAAAAASSTGTSQESTPKRASISGQTFIRTKAGNLVSLESVKRRKEQQAKKTLEDKERRLRHLVGVVRSKHAAQQKRGPRTTHTTSTQLCKYFTKTGQCKNALSCRFVHDSDKVAICPHFLRGKCKRTAASCALSHQPNAHRVPHCSHFPRCKRGDACMYAHVHVADDAPVCREFATLGWCDKGERCDKRHVWECAEFALDGKCSDPKCKLPHVLRRKPGAEDTASTDEHNADENDDDDDDEQMQRDEAATKVESKRKRKRATQQWAGISGEAGLRLSKKLKKEAKTDGVATNDDFITFDASDDDDGGDDDGDDASSEVDLSDVSDEDDDDEEEEESEDEEDEQEKETGAAAGGDGGGESADSTSSDSDDE